MGKLKKTALVAGITVLLIPENAHFELKVLAEGVSSKQEDSRADWGL